MIIITIACMQQLTRIEVEKVESENKESCFLSKISPIYFILVFLLPISSEFHGTFFHHVIIK